MTEPNDISQKITMGTNNTQIGVQNNYEEHHHHGLSIENATSMAITMFREYYPQLRQEALDELRQLVCEKLENIPAEHIVPPSPRIAVPTLQYASITEEHELRELYANLLAKSMNDLVKSNAHPSFLDIINHLSPDEARILSYMNEHSIIVPTFTIKLKIGASYGKILDDFTNIPELVACERTDPDSIEFHFNNLIRLGLLNKHYDGLSFSESTQAEFVNHPIVKKSFKKAKDALSSLQPSMRSQSELVVRMGYFMPTTFGKEFIKVCVDKRHR